MYNPSICQRNFVKCQSEPDKTPLNPLQPSLLLHILRSKQVCTSCQVTNALTFTYLPVSLLTLVIETMHITIYYIPYFSELPHKSLFFLYNLLLILFTILPCNLLLQALVTSTLFSVNRSLTSQKSNPQVKLYDISSFPLLFISSSVMPFWFLYAVINDRTSPVSDSLKVVFLSVHLMLNTQVIFLSQLLCITVIKVKISLYGIHPSMSLDGYQKLDSWIIHISNFSFLYNTSFPNDSGNFYQQ